MPKTIVFFFIVIFLLAFTITEKPTPYNFPTLKFFPKMPQSALNPVTVEGANLGRYLFYDPILSLNNDMSCATCHKQEKAFSDAPKVFSIGNKNVFTNRNTMPLFNLAWYSSFFWDGRASSIEEQVFHPVRDSNEMNLAWVDAEKRIRKSKFYRQKFKLAFGNQHIDSLLISKAIAQFLRTLISNQSKFDNVLAGRDLLTSDEYAGLVLLNDMTKGDCLHCHTTDANALGTTGVFSNNGLDNIQDANLYKDKGLGLHSGNVKDYGKFKTPSLRNIMLTAPYMHDGRFATIEEVLDFYSEGVQKSINIDSKMGLAHQGGVRLTKAEKMQIIAFLHTLTDSAFIINANHSNPFQE
jgi:cytochrome c peroxidase